ncbi:hypothetical protein JR334_09590 [Clostridia bacterium]|nr:hypothetical protein JR334_09590 [Clostridia bacterium]
MDSKKLFNNKWLQLIVILLIIFAVSRYAWNKNMQDIQTSRSAEESSLLVDSSNLVSLLEADLGSNKLKDVVIEKTDQGQLVTITFDPGKVWNEKSLLKEVAEASYKAFPLCFSDADISGVSFEAVPKNKQFVNLTFLRDDTLDLEWESLLKDVNNDYTIAYTTASSYTVHEALKDFLP